MYLKRIELEGFKSFADRTVIPVERGLTGIVGPNGCGKSNVVDALLWVMGERSSKALRADHMDDVIFKGAEGRKAAPYAMVEVILGDPEGKIVEVGGEIAVGRRLFANGDAEYLLHGRKVRRKDVREVLMDTGLGVQGYMVLAQGKIDAVLAANPADRRSVFEEAAGISRYKARKHETVLKLKRVELDLSRVDDVLEEVSRAVRSLRLQAGKARRFVEMRDRYRELRVRLAFADSSAFRTREKELRGSEQEIESVIDELRTERDSVAKRLAELEREEGILRERHDGLRAEAGEVKERAAGLEERVHGLETRASEGESRIERDRNRLATLNDEQQDGAETDRALQEEHDERTAALEQTRVVLGEAEAAFKVAREAKTALRTRMEELRRLVLNALQERTQWNNKVATAAKRRSEAEGGLKALERRRQEIGTEAMAVGSECKDLQQRLERLEGGVHDAELAAKNAQEEVERLRDERKGFATTAHDARQRRASAQARLEAFKVVDDEMPGVPEHLRNFIEEQRAGVGGWMLDDIQIEQPWDRMLENVLGRLQHAFWLTDAAAAEQLPEGVFDFFFADSASSAAVEVVEGAKSLRSMLSGNDAACDVLCERLGQVYCVTTAEEARAFASSYPHALFISADGEMHGRGYARCGILSEDAAGMLARRNGRDQAQTALEESEIEFQRAHALEEDAAAHLISAEQVAHDRAAELRTAVAAREEVAERQKGVTRREASLQEEARSMEREAQELAKVVEQATQVETEASACRDAVEQKRIQANGELENMQGEVDQREKAFESASHSLQEARVAHGGLEQEDRLWRNRHAELLARTEKQNVERGTLQKEVAELDVRCAELRAEAEEARKERTELLERRSTLTERVEEAWEQLQRASTALHGVRARSQDESGRLEQLLEKRQGLALEVQKVQMHLEELIRGVIEEFGQPLEDLSRGLEIDASQPLPEGVSESEYRDELLGLKRRMESIGSVNLDAVKELEERQERESFLTNERDDLLAAKTNLVDTLEELDIKCRERFVETFGRVQGQFEHIFRRLFRGGKASIQLEADIDPLDAGIDINVRPPGKDLRSINLLSGGERTLTALALLLAVFQSRPSPFCLLDEVDAALDDANVERFVDVLNDFTSTTQFLVVTHNRITMARCERLFGVTMRKRGVSMVVSVELDQVAGEGEMDLSQSEAVDPARARALQTANAPQAPLTPANRGVSLPDAEALEIVEKEMEAEQ
ncbi:MAG: chromosome segregation protein SMC [Planctomycetota bacterium]|jgi:chromosome segregation protein|nr:chromosome segregation protein SMC [Planctomycetota bacterium]